MGLFVAVLNEGMARFASCTLSFYAVVVVVTSTPLVVALATDWAASGGDLATSDGNIRRNPWLDVEGLPALKTSAEESGQRRGDYMHLRICCVPSRSNDALLPSCSLPRALSTSSTIA